MSIVVTPIPRLIDLAAPSFTLGTANAAGSAVTAVASDATLLAFDAVAPAPVASSAVVGSATVSSRRDHVHAGDITYETGTWTPTIRTSGETGSPSYGGQFGQYTKIGRLVMFSLRLEITGTTGLTGGSGAQIGGLPVASGSNTGPYWGAGIGLAGALNITAGQTVAWRITPNTSVAHLTLWDAATGTTVCTIDEVSSDGEFQFSGTYNT